MLWPRWYSRSLITEVGLYHTFIHYIIRLYHAWYSCITTLYIAGDVPVSPLHKRPVVPHSISAISWSLHLDYITLDSLYRRHIFCTIYHARYTISAAYISCRGSVPSMTHLIRSQPWDHPKRWAISPLTQRGWRWSLSTHLQADSLAREL